MHGAGMAGDLLVLGIYMLGMVAWAIFWLLCFGAAHYLFGKMTRYKWILLIGACTGLTVMSVYLALVETFERDNSDWWLVILGAMLPAFGIFYIQRRRIKSIY